MSPLHPQNLSPFRPPLAEKTSSAKQARRKIKRKSGVSQTSAILQKTQDTAEYKVGFTVEKPAVLEVPEVLDEELSALLDKAGVPEHLKQAYVRDLLYIINPVMDQYFEELTK